MSSEDVPTIDVSVSVEAAPATPPSPVILRAQTNMGWPTEEKWWYRILDEEQLMGSPVTPPGTETRRIIREGGLLRRMAGTKRVWEADEDTLDPPASERKSGQTDVVSFQPCLMPGNESQDRWIARKVVIRGQDGDQVWKVLGVFDGESPRDFVMLCCYALCWRTGGVALAPNGFNTLFAVYFNISLL